MTLAVVGREGGVSGGKVTDFWCVELERMRVLKLTDFSSLWGNLRSSFWTIAS